MIWNVPAGHAVHQADEDAPVEDWYVPAWQAWQTVLPVVEYDPESHVKHDELVLTAAKVPAAHKVHTLA